MQCKDHVNGRDSIMVWDLLQGLHGILQFATKSTPLMTGTGISIIAAFFKVISVPINRIVSLAIILGQLTGIDTDPAPFFLGIVSKIIMCALDESLATGKESFFFR